ncbi:MAG TPA: hypothetical protein PKM36_14200 [Propionibacteriaceae bacterium]|nr:hypothetical protein [Propionibacteriaceae bacterium]
MSAPVSAVLKAMGEGAGSLDEVARTTGLTRDLVDAAVAQLVRLGRVDSRELSVGCPPQGCGGCAVAAAGRSCGTATGSAARGGEARRAPLVTLSVRQR